MPLLLPSACNRLPIIVSLTIKCPQTLCELCHKAKVMQRCQAEEEGIVNFEEVVQVAERIVRAAEAIAEGRDGFVGLDVFIVVDVDIREPLSLEASICCKGI
jgi:hypothetical protein